MRIFIYTIIGISVLGSGVWYVSQSQSGVHSDAEQKSNLSENDATIEQFEGVGSFSSLMLRGSSVVCDFESRDETLSSMGTFYTDGERFRVTAETTMVEGTSETSMISTGSAMYTWSTTAEGTYAFMVEVPVEETDSEETIRDTSFIADAENLHMQQDVSYECTSWRVDESIFVPPNDIEFLDMQAMMESAFRGIQ